MLFGSNGLTIYSIGISCLACNSIFVAASSQTMITMVSAFYGQDDNTAIKYTIKKALKFVLIFALIIVSIFTIFTENVMHFFGMTDPIILTEGTKAIRLYVISFIGVGFSFMMMYYYQTIERTKFATFICLMEGLLIIVPCTYLLSNILGGDGIWISFLVNELISAILILIYTRYTIKKSKGKYHSLYLIKNENNFETTINLNNQEQINAFLSDKKIDKSKNKIDILNNLLLISQVAYSQKQNKNRYVDIIIKNNIISIKNHGKTFKELSDQNMKKTKQLMQDIEQKCKKVEYNTIIGMNYITVKI